MRRAYIYALSSLLVAAGAILAQQNPPVAPPAAQPLQIPQPQPQAPRASLAVVVLDAAHGATDAGARGESGLVEKELVLSMARALQAQLERQGLRVVLTRQADENPSFDDRAAAANAQQGAIFISLHVSSTGPVGTARTYYTAATPIAEEKLPLNAAGLVRWEEAQKPHAEQSRRLAELVQMQLGQKLRGSPEAPSPALVRQLRSVAEPAIAIELSSVAAADRKPLDTAMAALADGVARAVAAFKPVYEVGGN